ncbi:MAG: DUF4932 domain-containing protein [Flavobacteriaceae bacterium]
MKKLILFTLLFLSIKSFSQEKQIIVSVNKNVEFAAFLCWLVDFGKSFEEGTKELNWNNQKFQIHTYNNFKIYNEDPLLETFKKINRNEGLSSYIWLFAQLDDFPNAKLNNKISYDDYISYDDELSVDEKREITKKALSELNKFYKKINFDKFVSDNKLLYQSIINDVKSNLPDKSFLEQMESFYNQYDKNSFILNPSLLIPSGMGFGPTLNNNIYNFFGSFGGVDIENNVTNFNDKGSILTLTTHEFGHSFVNHIIDEVNEDYINNTKYLFEPIKASMSKQGYNNWKICLYEHFVRAGEIIISSNLGDKKGSDYLFEHHVVKNDFIYIPIILKHLNYYNHNKDKITYKESVEKAIIEIKNYR